MKKAFELSILCEVEVTVIVFSNRGKLYEFSNSRISNQGLATMVWCSHCGKDQRTEHDDINGFLCCTGCGRVVDDNIFSSDPTFIKSGAESQLSGNLVRYNQYFANRSFGVSSGGYEYKTDSHERTLDRGKEEIELIAGNLSLSQRDSIVESSHRLYIIAVERGFTKGRRVKQVAGATLYIICRQEQKPILLIDISDILQINIYVLGAVFLQLCGVLRLLQHPIIQKPVDPCLFIHRFADRLLGRSATRKQYHSICNTALRILTSMKRDWLQTGRKPSGLCGAALYISALSHGISCTKSEVISVVHICEATLTKRLIEFEETESGSLTIEEFESKAKELETEMQSFCSPANNQKMIESVPELVCEHKDLNGTSHFAHGLCHSCYEEIMKISGGLQGGSNPPAFQRAEKKRQEEALSKKQAELFEDEEDEENENQSIYQESLKQSVSAQETSDLDRKLGGVKSMPEKSALACDIVELQDECATASKGILSSDVGNGSSDKEDIDEMNMKGDGENEEHDETLSDIDDNEVDGYLHNEEEIKLKTIIWTEMNKDYLEELAEKEAANAAAHKAEKEAEEAEANGANNAVELRAKANALKKFKKKERTYKRAEETAKKVPAESAAEATRQILIKKKLSSKVNYDVLRKLFDEKKEDATEFLDNEVVEMEEGSRKRTVTWEDDRSEPHKKKADIGLIEKESEPKDEEADSMIDDEINYEDNDEQCQSFSLQYGAADYEDDYEEY